MDEFYRDTNHYSSQFIDIINRMVDPDPSKRPTAAEVVQEATSFLSNDPTYATLVPNIIVH